MAVRIKSVILADYDGGTDQVIGSELHYYNEASDVAFPNKESIEEIVAFIHANNCKNVRLVTYSRNYRDKSWSRQTKQINVKNITCDYFRLTKEEEEEFEEMTTNATFESIRFINKMGIN